MTIRELIVSYNGKEYLNGSEFTSFLNILADKLEPIVKDEPIKYYKSGCNDKLSAIWKKVDGVVYVSDNGYADQFKPFRLVSFDALIKSGDLIPSAPPKNKDDRPLYAKLNGGGTGYFYKKHKDKEYCTTTGYYDDFEESVVNFNQNIETGLLVLCDPPKHKVKYYKCNPSLGFIYKVENGKVYIIDNSGNEDTFVPFSMSFDSFIKDTALVEIDFNHRYDGLWKSGINKDCQSIWKRDKCKTYLTHSGYEKDLKEVKVFIFDGQVKSGELVKCDGFKEEEKPFDDRYINMYRRSVDKGICLEPSQGKALLNEIDRLRKLVK